LNEEPDMTSTTRLIGAAAACLVLAAGAQAQTAARDSDSSQLRAPTAAEAQALQSKAGTDRIGMLTGKINPQAIVHKDGTIEQELDASTMSFTVARRNPDGSVSMVCVTGEDQMKKALKAPNARSKSVAAKEHQHDVK
jgi:hypothetical protein